MHFFDLSIVCLQSILGCVYEQLIKVNQLQYFLLVNNDRKRIFSREVASRCNNNVVGQRIDYSSLLV
jgi:hypothetical protein